MWTGVAPIGFDPAASGGVHRRECGIADDDLMPETLQVSGDPFTFRGRLEQDPRLAPAQHRREPRRRGADSSFDEFTLFRQDTQLTLALMEIDPDIIHGWSPLVSIAAWTA